MTTPEFTLGLDDPRSNKPKTSLDEPGASETLLKLHDRGFFDNQEDGQISRSWLASITDSRNSHPFLFVSGRNIILDNPEWRLKDLVEETEKLFFRDHGLCAGCGWMFQVKSEPFHDFYIINGEQAADGTGNRGFCEFCMMELMRREIQGNFAHHEDDSSKLISEPQTTEVAKPVEAEETTEHKSLEIWYQQVLTELRRNIQAVCSAFDAAPSVLKSVTEAITALQKTVFHAERKPGEKDIMLRAQRAGTSLEVRLFSKFAPEKNTTGAEISQSADAVMLLTFLNAQAIPRQETRIFLFRQTPDSDQVEYPSCMFDVDVDGAMHQVEAVRCFADTDNQSVYFVALLP